MGDFDLARIDAVCARFASVPAMRGVAIACRGERLTEHYFGGVGPHLLQDVRSATKSVLSMLVGIAIHEGHIEPARGWWSR